MTVQEIIELTKRIRTLSEKEANILVLNLEKDSYMEGLKTGQEIAMKTVSLITG